MDKTKNENTKTVNQAWRKKPRKFAPKSRLGCKTCKIRRIKCDLSQPSCLKCQSTGRTCDGYGELPPVFTTEIESSHYHDESCDSYHTGTTISTYYPKQWHAKYQSLISQTLAPFMILPATGSGQSEAICFFEYISIKHLNEYHPCESWRKTLMYFSQTVPSVRYAAMALALIHRNQLGRDSGDRVHQLPLKGWSPDKAALLYYNRAIQLLLNQAIGDSTEETAITLLVCYLFTCFDHLAGDYVQAMKHLRGGVELARNLNKAKLLNDNNNNNNTHVDTLMRLVTRQIRRLDMQAVAFLIDWTPVDMHETPMPPHHPTSYSAFRDLNQAADHLNSLVARVMRLRITGKQSYLTGETLPSPSFKDIILRQLETWSSLFENMLQQGNSDSETHPRISLLRLQHTIIWTLLSSYGPGREMEYDNFLPQFRLCVALAGEVAAAHERYAGSLQQTFTPEIGILPVLYIVGAKCRDPGVRREVLRILRQQPMREAVWDSISAARVVERIMEIEEGGMAEEGEMAVSMERIAAWQRIEDLSWVHVVSAGRLDLTYTFCAREGTHFESLMI
ncbi:hypothetical protein F4678DRAFT_98987 [Xylaria arbuscula]|nr:hypothetical protein F4678DRAFT_98987 [Xylaria arbuscula]